ncbi:hypothetical protein MUK42_36788 [Musa troglodytarum]|uniref:Uncharacterized protein n=1 Tax=Musa troglodytarum TaxID=320322 RepID=A0A9E7KKI7_9LILI|nr:hypothetical protein MUK42_36788 [Musa troglodytarum]
MEMTQSEIEIRNKVDSRLDQSETKMEVTQSEIELYDKIDSHLDESEVEMKVTERGTSDSTTIPPEKMMTNLPTILEAGEEAELVPTIDDNTVDVSDGEFELLGYKYTCVCGTMK